MRRILLPLALVVTLGCGQRDKPADPSKKITWEQYQKMEEVDKADPYVLNNLDQDAQAKLAEMMKKYKQKK
jgi:hypothetical protein